MMMAGGRGGELSSFDTNDEEEEEEEVVVLKQEEEDLEEDANNDEGFRIQNLVSNNSPKGPSWKAAKPDIINSMEKERIVKAIRQKYWSNKDKDGLSSARQLSKEE